MTLWLLVLVPMLGAAMVTGRGLHRRTALALTACAALALTMLLALLAARGGWNASLAWHGAFRLQAALTPLSAIVAVLLPAVALPVLGYAAYHEHRPGLARLVALLLFFVGAMELLVIADDLLTLLVGWELVGACSWALIGHEWRELEHPRSGVFAFLATRLGDLGLFAAAMAAFAGTGSFAYADLSRLGDPLLGLVAGGVLLSAAAKSGQLPFSPWLFRAMAGPTSVSALLHAATMVAAGAYLLVRLQPMLDPVPWFGPAAMTIGLVTALAAGLVAVLQCHAKKLLAASTSAHFGLMFVAVGAGYPGVALLHLVAHACFKALLFLTAGIAGERTGGYALSRMRLGRALPQVAWLAAVGSLALAGVPPLGAAWTKEAVVGVGLHAALWVGSGAIVAGGLSAAYATRFQGLAFGVPPPDASPDDAREPPHRAEVAALGVLALATLLASVIWLPAARASLAQALGVMLPESTAAETAASLLAVAIGVLAGHGLVRRVPALGEADAPAHAAADWLGLPGAIEQVVTRPTQALARRLAQVDDAVINAAVLGIARGVRDASRGIAAADTGVVDRGTALIAAFTHRLSTLGNRVGEWAADGLPVGAARLVGLGATDLRPLQSGLSHHYFALMAAGAVVLVAILHGAG